MRVPMVSYPHQRSALSAFWIWAFLIDTWWYLILVLTCISLMTYNVEHLFICLFALCLSSLESCLLKSLAFFEIRLCIVEFSSLTFFFFPWKEAAIANCFSVEMQTASQIFSVPGRVQ